MIYWTSLYSTEVNAGKGWWVIGEGIETKNDWTASCSILVSPKELVIDNKIGGKL